MSAARTDLNHWLDVAASRRRAEHGVRTRRPLQAVDSVRVHDGTRQLLNFSSNDYLGMLGDARLRQAASSALAHGGMGSGASALVTGYRPAHAELEQKIADFLGREAALVFSSGYLANLAVATSLVGKKDHIVQDRLCHASLIDAARLSGAGLRRYPHCDVDGLERQLSLTAQHQAMVVTDGVFSMDGDTAPLESMAHIAQQHQAWLVVDDAHGIGTLGPGGGGAVAEAGLTTHSVPVLVGTLGKSFGCMGAFVAGSAALIDHLVNEGRTYLFTTALPPAQAAAASAAVELVRQAADRRERLQYLIARFCRGASELGLDLLNSRTPIQPLLTGSASRAMDWSERLYEAGFLVTAIRPPTVARGASRLRITLSAAHRENDVDRLLDALESCQLHFA